jgi:hypothetical protein
MAQGMLSHAGMHVQNMEDACEADSGKGLWLKLADIEELGGIVAALRSCAQTTTPLESATMLWDLSVRVWNLCVRSGNSLLLGHDLQSQQAESDPRPLIARLRQLACGLDSLVPANSSADHQDEARLRLMMSFKTGKAWLELSQMEEAELCFLRGNSNILAQKHPPWHEHTLKVSGHSDDFSPENVLDISSHG